MYYLLNLIPLPESLIDVLSPVLIDMVILVDVIAFKIWRWEDF